MTTQQKESRRKCTELWKDGKEKQEIKTKVQRTHGKTEILGSTGKDIKNEKSSESKTKIDGWINRQDQR